jgi:TOMM system kinase/cyclase fusion protein
VDSIEAIRTVLQARYELVAQLGEGGFGTVYKARQLATGQFVAVKVLRLPEGSSTQAHEKRIIRFQREMQICAQMHHPNIVRLIDSGQAESSLVYSVFEFVPGKNLAEVIAEEGRLEPVEARYFMMQALDALACAHRAGVVHRDFKPANVMIIPTGARRNALVLDFGIGALTQETRREEGARLTLTNESIGTPSYAAPEQLLGHALTPRSDLYAWGLVFLECLTGKRVIDGETVAEVVFKQLSPDPIAIPDALADHPLGNILRRATAKDPAAREVTAESLLRALEACDVSGLRQRTGPVQLQPASADAATATVDIANVARFGPRSQRLIEGERRQITAVCCTLAATGIGAKAADMEELDQILGAKQETFTEIAGRFGGHVAGALGDSVLFYFGYPTAHEDDARRAARAALAMVAEVGKRHDALEAERQVRVDLRIGIHTGLVVTRELRDSTVTGPGYVVGTTPKLATRIGAMAEPGMILVSRGTQRLLRKEFVLDESGLRAVDDATAPVEIFVLREGRAASGLREVALVGRERELETLLDRWSRVRGGAGQVVIVGGEPGIGKSRIARELAEKIDDEAHTWLECRCTPDSANSAFYPIIDLLDRLLDPLREVKPESKIDRLEALLSLHGFDLSEAMPLFGPLLSISLAKKWAPLDVSAQKQREMTSNAVLALLFEIAEKEPVALVIEDLHWADPSTIELLGQLVSEVTSSRVLAIFTARPEFTAPWPATAVLQLHLGRLGRPEVEQMAAKITGGRALPVEVLDQIAIRTDGVPLFVEELILTIIETGALVEKDGRYTLAKPLSEVAIPATLRDSLVARLDRLGRAKETAQLAAAIGREFTFELLRAISPLDETEAQADLDKLVAAELVYRKRRLKNPAYLFKHALVRDAAYESMLKRSQQQVHGRIARALEAKFPEIVSERPELMAAHLAAAEQKREAIGYAQKAAMGALMRSALAEAIAHGRQAIAWLPAVEQERERAELELGVNGIITPALMAAQGWTAPDLKATVDRSRDLFAIVGESPHTAPTLWILFLYHHVAGGDRALARGLAEQVLALAAASGDAGQLCVARCGLAQCALMEGDYTAAREHFDRSIALYDRAQHGGHAYIYGGDTMVKSAVICSLAVWYLGYPDTAQAMAAEGSAWAALLKHPNTMAEALLYQTFLQYERGNREETLRIAGELVALTIRTGAMAFMGYGSIFRCWAAGDLAGARGALGMMESFGTGLALSFYRAIVARVEAAHGHVDEAIERLDSARATGEKAGELVYLSAVARIKGELLLQRDAGAEALAEECFRRALTIAHDQQAKMLELEAAIALGQLLQKGGRGEEARALLAPLVGWFTEGTDTTQLGEARSLLSTLDGTAPQVGANRDERRLKQGKGQS